MQKLCKRLLLILLIVMSGYTNSFVTEVKTMDVAEFFVFVDSRTSYSSLISQMIAPVSTRLFLSYSRPLERFTTQAKKCFLLRPSCQRRLTRGNVFEDRIQVHWIWDTVHLIE